MMSFISLSGLDGAMVETAYGFPFGMAFMQSFAKGASILYLGVTIALLLVAILASFIEPDRAPVSTI
ncbi:MAG: hypothetical protein ACRC7C_06470 [Beijerinckiaceae bacterium]